MPYTENKSQKFDQVLLQALHEVSAEANYLDDLDDASLSEDSLRAEVKAAEDDIWKTVEVNLNKYDLLEQTLRDREKEFANASASENAEMSVSLDRVVESFEQDLDNLKSEIDASLLSQVKERLRLTVNKRVQPNYHTTLTMTEAPGLAEVLDPSRTVDTNAKSSLLYMLNTMPGGSIGIAGSRGAGKSTLIQMCCGPKRQLKEINDTPILPVLTSAPVKYEPRDFILYLFSAVCQRVLDPEDTNKELPQPPEVDGYSRPSRDMPVIDWLIRRSPGVLYKLGTVLMIVGLLVAVLLSFFPTPPANKETNPSQVQAAQTSAGSSGQNATLPVQTASPAPSPQPAMGRTRTFITNFLHGLEIKPGIAITWAIFLWLSGFALTLIRGAYLDIREFPTTYEQYVTASAEQRERWTFRKRNLEMGLGLSKGDTSNWALIKWARRSVADINDSRTAIARLQLFEARFQLEASEDLLKRRARGWLQETRFQQSFTSGWSGALKLPVGLEGGINRAVTLAQRQLSNPEIVAAYIKFVDEISKQYKLIIGIDELDKIESDDDARKFLNEIKSIFGLQNCFYLVSVSENAMANFERRGLPFRDVFDSSFDNVVFVDYLNHRTAKSLLERRIVGKPYPFIYLSYCLSGGLPRDLIRNFRSLLEFNQVGIFEKPGGKSLGVLCQAVVTADLKAKIRATMASAKKINSELAGSALTERLFEINSASPTPESLLGTVRTLLQWQPPMPPAPASLPDKPQDNSAELDKIKQVKALSSELGSYLYLLSTVLAFFNDKLDESKLKSAAQSGDLEKLANARQSMEINPSITVSLLDSLRTKWKIETLTPSASGNGSKSPGMTVPA